MAAIMDKNRAQEIFRMPENATKDEITRRYDILQRKMRSTEATRDSDEAKELEEAYKVLAGIAYVDPIAEKRLRERDEHPGLLARWLKMDQTKLDNIIHYYKKPVLAIAIVAALVIWMVSSTVFRPKDDFRMLITGDIYVSDLDVMEAVVKETLPETLHPMVQNIYYGSTTDAQMASAVMQKLMVEIGYGENDILVVDRVVFDQYATQGAFLPLDDRLTEFGTDRTEQKKQEVSLQPDVIGEGDDERPHIYGIDVTDSTLLKKGSLQGTEMIAVMGIKSQFPDKATKMMLALKK